MKSIGMRYLILFAACWLMIIPRSFCDDHFIENGFEFVSLYDQNRPTRNDSYVAIKGYKIPSFYDGRQQLHIPASVIHEGKCYQVKEIGKEALVGLPFIESIVIDEGIEKICDKAISYCTNLKSVSIPASVENLGNMLFVGCPILTELIVDPKNEIYDSRENSNAIIDCDDILVAGCNGTRIPSSIVEIGEDAFYGRNGLETLVIPEGVISIGSYAFGCCGSLNRVSLPSSLKEIRQSAFESCSSLDSVFIPENVSRILGGNLFAGCTRLSSIIVDKRNENYDSRSNCNGIVRKADSALIATCRATSLSSDISRLDEGCFYGVNIHSFILPKKIELFSAQAFYDCNEIDSLSVDPENPFYKSPEGSNVILTKDGKTLVMGCRTSIIPEGIESVEDDAFWGRYTNSLLKLPEGLEDIAWGAFRDCNKINSIIIPSSVNNIGWSAFSGCRNLVEMFIPEGVKSIGDYCFEDCERLAVIYIPSTVETIGYSSFRNCLNLNEIFFPDGVKEIGLETCKNCVNLKRVYLPSSIENVRSSAFENCQSLTEIWIPEGVKDIAFSTFKECVSLERVHFPSSLETIGSAAFQNCRNLTEIIIPEGVKKIGERAFKDCENLKRIKLPSSLEELDDNAFSGCPCEKSVKRFLKHKK